MTDLAEILHNIADHTETFYRFLSEPGVTPEIKARLIDHIVLEEQENTARLSALHGTNPTALTQKMLDHSYILQKVMNDATMPNDLKQELLHHFMEEHQEWQMQVTGTPTGHTESGTTSSTTSHSAHQSQQSKTASHSVPKQNEPETREWTVGPLWNQGG